MVLLFFKRLFCISEIMKHVNQKNQIYKFYFTCNLITIYNRNNDDGNPTLHQRAKNVMRKDVCAKRMCICIQTYVKKIQC